MLGTLQEVYAWSNRPVWAQGPGRRMDLDMYRAQALAEVTEQEGDGADPAEIKEIVDELVGGKAEEIARALERLDWKSWLGVAPPREYLPGLYHSFQHRGWWDFGTGALGDMACHMLTVPFASCGLRDQISVQAK